jgi:hypothetical protein
MAVHHLAHDEVSVHVKASPHHVYALVADVTRMGDWSPECHRCEWTDGATGPIVGARFKAWNRRKLARWSNKPTVIAADPGREFAFTRTGPGSGEVVWRYRLEVDDGGTRVTESYEATRRASPLIIWLTLKLMRINDREADLRTAMRATLHKIKSAAEAA